MLYSNKDFTFIIFIILNKTSRGSVGAILAESFYWWLQFMEYAQKLCQNYSHNLILSGDLDPVV